MIELVRLCLIVGGRCNRRCTYCIQRGAAPREERMRGEVLEYLKSLAPGGVTRFC